MSDFQVAAVFSDHCVLQRNKNIKVFGYSRDSLEVSVSLEDSKGKLLRSNKALSFDGRWEVTLEALDAQTDLTMKVQAADNLITFTDIAIGEVWLAGGQSNMEFELQNCSEGPAELELKEDPKVRFYYTNKIGWMDQAFYEAEKNTCWQTWESEWKKAWSAVGYFYAKQLAADLGVTVGVIGCNWGGTSASAWMAPSYLEKDQELKTYLTEYEEAEKGKSLEEQCAEYDAYVKENDIWQEKCAKIYSENPNTQWNDVIKVLGPCPWPGPKNCKNPYRPCGLYQTMLQRIIPYSIKGVIWYQGESDDHKPAYYYKLFTNMIDNWRVDWKDNSLPFVFVQLPEHRYIQDKDYKNWSVIREAQQKVAQTVKNAYMVVAADLGQYNDIHPKAKKVLGQRMEAAALYQVYNKGSQEKALAPVFTDAISKDGKLILNFDFADQGFVYREDKKELQEMIEMEKIQGNEVSADFTAFEIASNDRVFYNADFELKGNQIILSCPKVKNPLYARYAWYNYGPVSIFTKAGLPLPPFRSNPRDSEEVKEHAEIQQVMTVNSK
ncbi:MAG: sialate O-acetylesterase [Treponema sp.]|nr:sialate O-acetylesterase [Treponema sp.]